MTTLQAVATSATSVALTLAGTPAAAAAVQVQYGLRSDFNYSLSPVLQYAPATSIGITGLNQATRYFWRARAVDNTGSPLEKWSDKAAIYTPAQALRSLAPSAVMNQPALLVPPAHILQWWPSSEQAGYPARALGRDDPNSTWVAQQSGGVVALDMQTTGEPIDTIAVLATTAAENATIKVSAGGSRSAAISSPTYSTGVLPFRASAGLPGREGYHSLVRLPTPVQAPFWRIEIGGDTPGQMFAATYAMLGLASSTINFSSDKGEVLNDRGSIDRDRSNNPARVAGRRGRTVDFELSFLTEAQYEGQIERLRWLVGITDPILVVPNAKPGVFLHDRILYGQLGAGRASNTSVPWFTQAISVNSLI